MMCRAAPWCSLSIPASSAAFSVLRLAPIPVGTRVLVMAWDGAGHAARSLKPLGSRSRAEKQRPGSPARSGTLMEEGADQRWTSSYQTDAAARLAAAAPPCSR